MNINRGDNEAKSWDSESFPTYQGWTLLGRDEEQEELLEQME